MRCEIPHRCVRRKYRIRRHSPFRLRNCWEGRSVRASSLLRQLAKGGCAARRLSWVTPGFSQSRRCKTTASEFFYAPCSGALSAAGVVVTRSVTATLATRRSEEHTSELQSPCNLVCRLLLEKKKKNKPNTASDALQEVV